MRYYYNISMIKSFKSKEAEKIFNQEYSSKLPYSIQRTALRKLWMIDAAVMLDDLKSPPANRLERLKGRRTGTYSIRINDQWRICFEWIDGYAFDVEIVDYHK